MNINEFGINKRMFTIIPSNIKQLFTIGQRTPIIQKTGPRDLFSYLFYRASDQKPPAAMALLALNGGHKPVPNNHRIHSNDRHLGIATLAFAHDHGHLALIKGRL